MLVLWLAVLYPLVDIEALSGDFISSRSSGVSRPGDGIVCTEVITSSLLGLVCPRIIMERASVGFVERVLWGLTGQSRVLWLCE